MRGALAAALLLTTGLLVAPAAPARAAPAAHAAVAATTPIPVPPLETTPWDGRTGVVFPAEPYLRDLVAEIAELNEEPEIREAAAAALASTDPDAITRYFTETHDALQHQIELRHEETARRNTETIRAMADTGTPGGYLNAEVTRVLRGTDADREAFLAYGADIARTRDQQATAAENDRKRVLRDRLTALAATAADGTQMKIAATAALAGGDTAVAAFWTGGYLTAATADAAAREQYLADLEARNKAAEDLTDLARRAARASEARRRMLVAHGNAVRELERSSNAMAGAANAARSAQRILAGGGTAAEKSTQLTAARTETQAQLTAAQQAAQRAQAASAAAVVESQILIDTGLEYGAEWSRIVQGMHQATVTAVGAATTAAHAVDATIATHNAQTAADRAAAHEREAEKWREHAEEHAAAAAKLAEAAKAQAQAAKTAAARAKSAREQAQAAEARAWAAAERTRQQRVIAEAEAAKALSARQVAEKERQVAAQHRVRAETQAATAATARRAAETQAGLAAAAERRAKNAENAAEVAAGAAWDKEGVARRARDAAKQAEFDVQVLEAKAQAYRAQEAAAGSAEARDEAGRQAALAEQAANAARGPARAARAAANNASGAAVNARAEASESTRAAERSWAAAGEAKAAAERADAAAGRAEAEAKATHQARMEADAHAAEATAQQARAAEAAKAAVRLAEQAAEESVQALWAAQRTQQEAEQATTEAVAASAQAEIAVSAAAAARTSAAGIAEPYNVAIAMVTPFTGVDIDADFTAQVAAQARAIGAEQAAAATARANEALAAAQRAQEAARNANEQTKAAFTAAAAAAQSASDAAAAAAEAKHAAADAAADGAAARTAAASAARADSQARNDAVAARSAANEAAKDAQLAGRSASEAQGEADRAQGAARAAAADAKTAAGAASAAESAAAAAAQAAENAQGYAESAVTAAADALQHAIDAEAAAARAEDAERGRLSQAVVDGAPANPGTPAPGQGDELLSYLSDAERAEFLQAQQAAGESVFDFILREGEGLIEDLTGIADIRACVLEADLTACLWTVISFVPIGKFFTVAGKLVRLAAKLTRFFDDAVKAQRRLDELTDLAKRAKTWCGDNSFVAGTAVLLANGTTKAIETIRIGDRVLATDPTTDVTRAEPVTALHRNRDKDLTDVAVQDMNGRRTTLHTTPHHPFWNDTEHNWTDAAALRPGTDLRTTRGGGAHVSATRSYPGHRYMYNLTVANIHTYYVLAGHRPILVHNCGRYVDGDFPDTGQTSLYALQNPKSGEILKWGISKSPTTRYSCGCYQQLDARMQIIKNFDTRGDALAAERYLTERYPGPKNFESWAGSVDSSGTWQDGVKHVTGGGL
jgi:hypothetical protein